MLLQVLVALAISALASLANAQTVFPANRGDCPSGSRYSGSGYCTSIDGSNFITAHNGNCPNGSRYSGSGYCRSPQNLQFVPSNKGNCPSGTRYAGGDYCAVGK